MKDLDLEAMVAEIHQINATLRPLMKRPSSADDVTFEQYRILNELAKAKASTSQIAQRIGVGQSMVSTQISRLLANKYITDETLTTDRRYHMFALTDQGRRVHDRVAASLSTSLPVINAEILKMVEGAQG